MIVEILIEEPLNVEWLTVEIVWQQPSQGQCSNEIATFLYIWRDRVNKIKHPCVCVFRSGQKFEVHSCDILAVCEDQKNRCIDQDGATQCCCDGEL